MFTKPRQGKFFQTILCIDHVLVHSHKTIFYYIKFLAIHHIPIGIVRMGLQNNALDNLKVEKKGKIRKIVLFWL